MTLSLNVNDVKRKIIDALKNAKRPLTVSDIEALTYLPWYTINHYINSLVKQKRVKMTVLGRKTRIFEPVDENDEASKSS